MRLFRSINLFFAAALALGITASPALAQTPSSDEGTLLRNFDIETLIPVVQEMGMSWEGRTAPDGRVLLVTAPTGLKFILSPTSCRTGRETGCAGLNMVALFKGQADQRTVNSFNYRYAFTSAGIDPSGSAYISRYEIADYGTPKGNLMVSMNVFLNQAAYLNDSLRTATKTVSLDASPDDFAARALNMADADSSSHEASIESTRELVKVLVKAEEQAPGKIANFTK